MAVAHIGVVWNPAKGDRDELQAALQAATEALDAAPRVTWAETSEDDPGVAATERALAAGADLIVAAGGDGTVRAVVEHLADAKASAELGIVPLGTGNLLARNLGVPIGDTSAALERALTGTGRAIDVGWAEVDLAGGTRRCAFAVMAGFGVDAHMITETDGDLKEKVGWLAYVESLGRAVAASEVIDIEVSVDGAPAVAVAGHTVIVGNCGALQGGLVLLPDADPADGRLDVLLLDAAGLGGWLDTLRSMVWDNGIRRALAGGTAESSATTTHRQVERIELALASPRVFEIDGDELGETTRISITVQPAAVRAR